jgi:DNA-binding transcriptional MerR regulator
VFPIGDFSKITGLTVKTLRFYHEQGLLVPSHVDPETGYRYYHRSKIETARIIAHLRSLDLSIEEIREILAHAGDDADLRAVMERQKGSLEGKIKRYREIVRSIKEFLDHDDEAKKLMAKTSFDVEDKVAETILVAGIRMNGRYADCGAAFARIGKAIGRWISGKPMLLHYDAEYREDDADFEVCFPVLGAKPADGISVRELPGGPFVSLLHLGPYEELGRSYSKILDSVRNRRIEIVIPTREVYHKGPGMIFRGNPKSYLTEIQFPIKG